LYTREVNGSFRLTKAGAEHFSSLAMKCIVQEFPNKTGHVQANANDLKQPSDYHPAFYGCFDWHSAVHGHWMLIKLLKEFPDMVQATAIRETINRHFTREKIAIELAYFNEPHNRSFERTYGWAWLLKLAEELYTWDDPQGQIWYENLKPLAEHIADAYIEFLPKLSFPNRTGVHQNTAFGLSFAWDYAMTLKNSKLASSVWSYGMEHYFRDSNCPAQWEPGGTDFFSPCLMQADLMVRVIYEYGKNAALFQEWLNAFLPKLVNGQPAILFSPVSVTDRSDGHLVHLDGLNLSRAWCFLNIAAVVENPVLREKLLAAAEKHLAKTIPLIADGDYAGEHWLASFAVYALYAGVKF
jgi:hypothetical protein